MYCGFNLKPTSSHILDLVRAFSGGGGGVGGGGSGGVSAEIQRGRPVLDKVRSEGDTDWSLKLYQLEMRGCRIRRFQCLFVSLFACCIDIGDGERTEPVCV